MVFQNVPSGNPGAYFPLASNESSSLVHLWPGKFLNFRTRKHSNTVKDAIETLPDNLTALIVAAVVTTNTTYNTLYTVQAINPSTIPKTGLSTTRVAGTPYGLFYQVCL